MKIVGLTGGSGAGKGTVSMLFRELGCIIVDTDLLYHSMISADSECSRAIIAQFGDSVKNESGGIDRRLLANIVFSDRTMLDQLNVIAHAHVRAECDHIIESNRAIGTEIMIIDAPQLFEAEMDKICDVTVAVIANELIRIDRICKRDHITEENAIARIRSQRSDAFFRENCNYVIENDHDVARLLVRVKHVLDDIKDL